MATAVWWCFTAVFAERKLSSGSRDTELLSALTRQVSRELLQQSTPDAVPLTSAATLVVVRMCCEVCPWPVQMPMMAKNGPEDDIVVTTLGGHRHEKGRNRWQAPPPKP